MARGGSSVPSVRRSRHRAASVAAIVVLLTGLLPVAAVLPVAAADPAPTHRFLSDDGAAGSTGSTGSPAKGAQFATASTTLNGFSDTNVWTGMTLPISLRFASDGRVFVAEKSGIIKVFDSVSDTTPTVFADLTTEVHNYWDRGLLGMTLDPNFPASPYVYALYARDAIPGGTPPRWNDVCPTSPGPNTDGCLVTGRLVRLTMGGGGVSNATKILIDGWCQQFPSHSVGDLRFGADGALYVTGGDGASFNNPDWGQYGGTTGVPDVPKNPCGDPPGGSGSTLTPPSARGGALRSQSIRRPAGDPVLLNGSLLRVDPATGDALPNNPRFSSTDANARRIVAHGFRNPFRFTIRPGTSEPWIGDVGWTDWEEIDRIVDPLAATIANAGWPCYEGNGQQSGYQSANLALCSSLYTTPTGLLTPYYTYSHGSQVVPGEVCQSGSSSISGITFYQGGNYPASYTNGLFFADHSRNCIWFMRAGTNGLPDKNQISTFISTASNPVDLETGPNGDLFYVDFEGGNIHRVTYASGNQAPTAVIGASPASGPSPLLVNLDGTGSTDPEGSALTYAWDLDDDGQYDDSTASKPTVTFTTSGSHTVRLRVTDAALATGTASRPILVDDALPTPVIDTPATGLTWKVGDNVSFTGHATDGQGNALPASGLSWALVIQHCPSNCHTHSIQSWTGVAGGSFAAPDHDYPSYLELTLTATDASSRQASTTIRLDPRTVNLTFQSNPTGLSLVVGTQSEAATPFTRTVIVGSNQGVTAGSPQTLAGTTYVFGSWSDAGAATHTIVAPATATTYTANYVLAPPGTTSYLSDLAYTVTSNGWGPAEKDQSNGEAAAGDGKPITLNGTVFAKGLGVHAVSDIRYTMSNCTAFTASVGVDDEVVSTRGSIVFQVYLDGVVAYDSGTMTGATATKAVSVNTTGKTALRLVVAAGSGVDYGHGDWADAKLTCGSGGPVDTTPPTVTSSTPANGATGQPTGTAPTAVFSEAIDQATLTTTSFSVTDQTTAAAVAGSVGYDGANRRATFTPSAALVAGRTYLARVLGGGSGIADVAGNRLAADVTWTFTTAAVVDTTPPTVTGFTPASGATGQSTGTAPTATFSEAINAATLTTTTFSLTDQTTAAAVAGSVGYNSGTRTATFTPSAALVAGRTYLARVLGGGSGIADVAGNRLAADVTWTFTTAAVVDTTPPTVTGFTPASGATGQSTGTAPTATFSEAINAATLTTTTFSLTDQTTAAAVAGSVGYNSGTRTATFTPSAALVAGRTYLARVLGGATGVADVAGNRLAADVTWTFTTATGTGTTSYLSDLAYTVTSNGWGPAEKDQSNGEAAAGDGKPITLNGTVFAKGLGVHAVSDIRYTMSNCTAFTASVGVDDEVVSTRGSIVFQVYLDGVVAYDSGTMTGATATKAVSVNTTGKTALRLVVAAGSGVDYGHGDWADAKLTCGSGGPVDTTPPTVTSSTPANGATGQPTGTAPTAVFSEAIDQATLTTTSFSVTDQTTAAAVAGSVGYDGANRRATFTPSAALVAGRTYLARVLGGGSGIADVAGNRLAADVTWTFTTAAVVDTTPPTVTGFTPASGATGQSTGTAPTATFSEAINAATLTTTTFSLTDQTTAAAVAGSVGYNSGTRTATFTPSAALVAGRTYLARVLGGGSGIADVAGNRLAADVTWTFTTAAVVDTTPPTVTGFTPASGATGQSTGTAPTATFSEAINAATLTTTTFSLTDQTTAAAVAGSVGYNSGTRTATFTPSAALVAGRTYLARVLGGATGVADVAGNRLAADVTWTFTTATGTGTTSYLSDLAYTVTSNGWGPAEKDQSNGEAAAGDGKPITLNGTVFAKGLGVHAVSDIRYTMSNCTAFTASVGVDDEVVSTRGSIVFQVYLDGVVAYDSGTMTGATATKAVSVNTTGKTALRLVVAAGSGVDYGHGDWADAKLTCG